MDRTSENVMFCDVEFPLTVKAKGEEAESLNASTSASNVPGEEKNFTVSKKPAGSFPPIRSRSVNLKDRTADASGGAATGENRRYMVNALLFVKGAKTESANVPDFPPG